MRLWGAALCVVLLLASVSLADKAQIQMSGLQPLGGGFEYWMWVLFDPVTSLPPQRVGKLTPSVTGDVTMELRPSTGQVLPSNIYISINSPGIPSTPGSTIAAAGSFSGVQPDANGDYTIDVSFDSTDACGAAFPDSIIQFFLWSYSDVPPTQLCGVWFLNTSGLLPTDSAFVAQPGLKIPDLPSGQGWKYEGWLVSQKDPNAPNTGTLSTGKFTKYATDPAPGGGLYKYGADEDGAGPGAKPDSAACCGGYPAFPGSEWVTNPVELVNGGSAPYTLFISVEPEPDDNPNAPYGYRPFIGGLTNGNQQQQLSIDLTKMGRGTVVYTMGSSGGAASALQLAVACLFVVVACLLL